MSDENDNNGDGEWDEKSDLTRIEDLSEFLHVEDDDLNQKFEKVDSSDENENDQNSMGEDLLALDDLEDDDQEVVENITENQFESEEDPPPFENEEDDSDGPAFGSETSDFEETTEPSISLNSDSTSEENDSNAIEESIDDTADAELDLSGAFGVETSDDDDDAKEEDWLENSGDSFFDSQSDDSDDGDGESNQEDDTFNPSLESSFDNPDPDPDEDEDEDQESEASDTDDHSFEFPDPEDLETARQEKAHEFSEQSSFDNSEIAPEVRGFSQESEQEAGIVQRENFQDLREFGNSISYGLVQTGGNPPYSLIVRHLKFEEDARDILIILREHGLVTSENEDTIAQGLEQGSLLISQISEYSAIYLAHKLRRFDLDLRIGLSDQLHPSKSYNSENKGLVSKHNLGQNFQEDVLLEDRVVAIEDIVLATTPSIEGYSIYRYLDIITSHTVVREDELKRLSASSQGSKGTEAEEVSKLSFESDFYQELNLNKDDADIMNNYSLGLNEIYHELSLELKNQAFKREANAVVGINFALTPLIDTNTDKGTTRYKITCSGNAVWIVDKQD